MHVAPELRLCGGTQQWRWHGTAGALAVHVAAALLWLAVPAPVEVPDDILPVQVIELIQTPPPPAATPEPPAPAKATAAPASRRVAAAPTPAPSQPTAIADATPSAATPVAAPPQPAPAAVDPDLEPRPTETPRPPYPPVARKRGWQGVVTLLVQVAEDGRPLEVTIKKSSGHSMLDDAARDAMQSWRFAPARQGGRTVAAAVEVPVRFALEG